MATVDRDQLYQDVISILPTANSLTESLTRTLNETVILAVGDDSLNYPEILCKSLKANATQNMANATVDSKLKRKKTGQVEVEWYNNTKNFWKDWIISLKDICPLYGYTIPTSGLSAVQFINFSAPTLTIEDSCCTKTLT